MKIFFGALSTILSFVTLYFFLQANTVLDLAFAMCCLLGAIIFILFGVIEEQKESIENYRKVLYHKKTFFPIEAIK